DRSHPFHGHALSPRPLAAGAPRADRRRPLHPPAARGGVPPRAGGDAGRRLSGPGLRLGGRRARRRRRFAALPGDPRAGREQQLVVHAGNLPGAGPLRHPLGGDELPRVQRRAQPRPALLPRGRDGRHGLSAGAAGRALPARHAAGHRLLPGRQRAAEVPGRARRRVAHPRRRGRFHPLRPGRGERQAGRVVHGAPVCAPLRPPAAGQVRRKAGPDRRPAGRGAHPPGAQLPRVRRRRHGAHPRLSRCTGLLHPLQLGGVRGAHSRSHPAGARHRRPVRRRARHSPRRHPGEPVPVSRVHAARGARGVHRRLAPASALLGRGRGRAVPCGAGRNRTCVLIGL
ncbi:MAG: Hydrolase, alpha/beta fold family functionally coupled to Phosphoribulokinase, partial [uncultured Gemmatimonadetes bacterium]